MQIVKYRGMTIEKLSVGFFVMGQKVKTFSAAKKIIDTAFYNYEKLTNEKRKKGA